MRQRTPRGLRACDYAEGLRIAKHDQRAKKGAKNRYHLRKTASIELGLLYDNNKEIK